MENGTFYFIRKVEHPLFRSEYNSAGQSDNSMKCKSRQICFRQPVILIAAIGLVAVGVWTATCQVEDSIKSRPDGVTQQSEGNLIKEGFGIDKCHIGMPVAEVISKCGQPDETEKLKFRPEDAALYFYDEGIMIARKDNKVNQVYFDYLKGEYPSKQYKPFTGATNRGIRSGCTMADVIVSYGRPSQTFERRFSKFGRWPGKRDTAMEYPKLGISIYFVDDQLGDIRVYPPRVSDQ